jgi:hypothetical protein
MKNKIKFKITFIFWFCLKKKPQEQFFDIYLFFLQKKHMFDININLRLIIAVTSILVFGQNLIISSSLTSHRNSEFHQGL